MAINAGGLGTVTVMAKRPPLFTQAELDAVREGITFDAETARLMRLYLERVSCALERKGVSKSATYLYAFKLAARSVRMLKPD